MHYGEQLVFFAPSPPNYLPANHTPTETFFFSIKHGLKAIQPWQHICKWMAIDQEVSE